MDPKIKLCICKVMSNAISKTGCIEHTVSGTVSVDDSYMFITTYILKVSQHSWHYQANAWSFSTNTHTQPKRKKKHLTHQPWV